MGSGAGACRECNTPRRRWATCAGSTTGLRPAHRPVELEKGSLVNTSWRLSSNGWHTCQPYDLASRKARLEQARQDTEVCRDGGAWMAAPLSPPLAFQLHTDEKNPKGNFISKLCIPRVSPHARRRNAVGRCWRLPPPWPQRSRSAHRAVGGCSCWLTGRVQQVSRSCVAPRATSSAWPPSQSALRCSPAHRRTMCAAPTAPAPALLRIASGPHPLAVWAYYALMAAAAAAPPLALRYPAARPTCPRAVPTAAARLTAPVARRSIHARPRWSAVPTASARCGTAALRRMAALSRSRCSAPTATATRQGLTALSAAWGARRVAPTARAC